DPAYAEEKGSYSYPDPPRKPFPPHYSQRRRISGHLAITRPAGDIPEATHPPVRSGTRGNPRVMLHGNVIVRRNRLGEVGPISETRCLQSGFSLGRHERQDHGAGGGLTARRTRVCGIAAVLVVALFGALAARG
ncbi:MAG TPA: hypothetical protein VFQ68_35620, partial [Streptosporangiaceae bacterium]|nr:hypothetical protein [Streptosporangiaceae bacterium]